MHSWWMRVPLPASSRYTLGRSQYCVISSNCTGPACVTAICRSTAVSVPRYQQSVSMRGNTWNGPTPNTPRQVAARGEEVVDDHPHLEHAEVAVGP